MVAVFAAGVVALSGSASATIYSIDFESLAAGTQLTSSVGFNGNTNANFDSRFIAPGNVEYSTIQNVGSSGPLTGNVVRTTAASGNTNVGSVDFVPFPTLGYYLGGIAVGQDSQIDMNMRITVFNTMGGIITQRNFMLPGGPGTITSTYIDLSDIATRSGGIAIQNVGGLQTFGHYFYWDNFTYSDTPVPAPGAMALFSCGAIFAARRRRA